MRGTKVDYFSFAPKYIANIWSGKAFVALFPLIHIFYMQIIQFILFLPWMSVAENAFVIVLTQKWVLYESCKI